MLSRLSKFVIAFCIPALWLLAGLEALGATEYRLGAQEKLRLRVIEWRADESQPRARGVWR